MNESDTSTKVTPTVETEGAAEQLQLNDLVGMIGIIDNCSKRGAFEGAEMETVGALRTRVVTFIKSVAPQAKEVEESASDNKPQFLTEGTK